MQLHVLGGTPLQVDASFQKMANELSVVELEASHQKWCYDSRLNHGDHHGESPSFSGKIYGDQESDIWPGSSCCLRWDWSSDTLQLILFKCNSPKIWTCRIEGLGARPASLWRRWFWSPTARLGLSDSVLSKVKGVLAWRLVVKFQFWRRFFWRVLNDHPELDVKLPAGPETVLVKPHVFIKMSVALWRNDDFGSA